MDAAAGMLLAIAFLAIVAGALGTAYGNGGSIHRLGVVPEEIQTINRDIQSLREDLAVLRRDAPELERNRRGMIWVSSTREGA